MCELGALLLSRQKLAPSRKCSWVQKTLDALGFFRDENLTLLTSIGTPNWELPLVAAVLDRVNVNIVVCAENDCSFQQITGRIYSDFNLSNNSSFTHFPISTSKKSYMHIRDQYIMDSADILFPVSIRTKGFMEKSLQKNHLSKKTDCRFLLHEKKRTKDSVFKSFSDIVLNNPFLISSDHLVHWTRTSLHPWPDESAFDFYKDIIKSQNYPRSAFHALFNILSSQTVYASNRHMAKNIYTVCLSGNSPTEFFKLMRWRKRYVQMAFEPYGIGIEKNTALSLGIRPVIYTDPQKTRKLNYSERWMYQSSGKSGNWLEENEYRYRGNLSLKEIPKDKLIAYCLYPCEADFLRNRFGIETIPFSRFNPESMSEEHQ